METYRKMLVVGGTVLILLSLVPLGISLSGTGASAPVETLPERSAQRLSITLMSLVTLSVGGLFLFRFIRAR